MLAKYVLLVDQSIPDYQVFLDSVNDLTCAVLYSSSTNREELNEMIEEPLSSRIRN